MTRASLTRRAALAAIAGSVLVPTGCGGVAILRLPWAKIVGAVIRFVKDHGTWVLVLVGLDEAGQQVSKEVRLDSAEIRSVTVELKDGTRHTITPEKEPE